MHFGGCTRCRCRPRACIRYHGATARCEYCTQSYLLVQCTSLLLSRSSLASVASSLGALPAHRGRCQDGNRRCSRPGTKHAACSSEARTPSWAHRSADASVCYRVHCVPSPYSAPRGPESSSPRLMPAVAEAALRALAPTLSARRPASTARRIHLETH